MNFACFPKGTDIHRTKVLLNHFYSYCVCDLNLTPHQEVLEVITNLLASKPILHIEKR